MQYNLRRISTKTSSTRRRLDTAIYNNLFTFYSKHPNLIPRIGSKLSGSQVEDLRSLATDLCDKDVFYGNEAFAKCANYGDESKISNDYALQNLFIQRHQGNNHKLGFPSNEADLYLAAHVPEEYVPEGSLYEKKFSSSITFTNYLHCVKYTFETAGFI